ncbi:hypothetical protein EST38_g11838 [Candolleomyces aberdarensis]|uniref:Uncharacterized protein n=1 Tax=Candolleomyces aberdarensis TaxID=2316362 RepID=A0A4Q2D776_9AGAR|nr:hypothetical protein EST38_g11838 [Candolleomyces aberdarensis]
MVPHSYFNHSSRIAITSWSTVESSALEKCGHCDNCVRSPASVVLKDVTLPAWQILRVVYEITNRMGGKVTLNMLKGLVRGKGGGKIDVAVAGGKGRGKKQQKEKVEVDLARVCGGPVGDLSGDDVEHLIVFLLIKRYLKEIIVSTSYAANVYLGTSEQAAVYTRHSRHDVEGGNKARKLELCFVKQEKPPRKPRSTAATTAPTTADGKTVPKKRKVSDRNANAKDKLEKGKDKGKARATADDEDDMYDEDNSSYLNAARKRRDARVEGSDSGGEYIDPDEGLELASDVDMDDDEHMTMPPPPPPRRPPTATTSTTKKEIVRSTARTAAQSESPSQSSMGAAGSRQANNTVASSNRQSKPARTSKPAPPEVIDIADSDDDDESDERALSRSRRAARSAPSPSPRLPPPPLLPPKRAGKPLWTEENELEYGGREDEEDVISDSEDGEDEMHQWLFNQRGTTTKSGASAAAGSGGAGPPKKRFKPNTDPPLAPPNRTAKMSGQSRKGGVAAMNEPDVIVLSDSD